MKDYKTKSEISREKKDSKESFEKKESEYKNTAEDKLKSVNAINDLKLQGSLDLFEQIKKTVNNLNKFINTLIDKHENESEVLLNKDQIMNKDLKEKSSLLSIDSKNLESTSSLLNDTKSKEILKSAELATQNDKDFIDAIRKERETKREEYRNIVGNEVQKAMNAQFRNFSKFGGFF